MAGMGAMKVAWQGVRHAVPCPCENDVRNHVYGMR